MQRHFKTGPPTPYWPPLHRGIEESITSTRRSFRTLQIAAEANLPCKIAAAHSCQLYLFTLRGAVLALEAHADP